MNPQPVASRGMKTAVVICILVLLLCVGIAYLVFWPDTDNSETGGPGTTSCIQVPESNTAADRRAALDLATKLEGLPLDSDLKVNFERTSKTVYQELSEKNTALLLLLRAIECYFKIAETDEERMLAASISADLAATARGLWAAANDLRGTTDRLSLKELALLEGSPHEREIKTLLNEYGIRTE